jgi:hypothetical protein
MRNFSADTWFFERAPMLMHKLRKLVFLSVAGVGFSIAATQPISASGRVAVVDPNCDQNCRPTCCQQFCRTLKLHCVYFRRSCSQKFVLVPTPAPSCPAPESPAYRSPSPYPTINGYGVPQTNPAPAGVFIR